MGHPSLWSQDAYFVIWTGVRFFGGVGAVAAPRGQSSGRSTIPAFDWIAVHVAELFGSLGFGEDVEVVVAGFPYKLVGAGSREALLENLNRRRQFLSVRLGYEEMNVIGHKDMPAEDLEEVIPAGFFFSRICWRILQASGDFRM